MVDYDDDDRSDSVGCTNIFMGCRKNIVGSRDASLNKIFGDR